MTRAKRGSLIMIALMLVGVPLQAGEHESAVRSLVETELAYARMASTAGVRDAYLANNTQESLLFGPTGPVLGQKFYGEMPPMPPSRLLVEWYPSVAEVAANEDIGVTAGPFTAHIAGKQGPVEQPGMYLSVWRKQAGGAWKVILDAGVPTDSQIKLPRYGESGAPALLSPGAITVPAALDQSQLDRSLLEADKRFAAQLGTARVNEMFAALALPDVIVIRNGIGMLVGRDKVIAASNRVLQAISSQTIEVRASQAGDLGYSYGSWESNASNRETLYYIRVWRRVGDDWKILLDIVNVPPPAPTPLKQRLPKRQNGLFRGE